MNIMVLCDLEGTAGVVDFQTQTYDNTRYNDQAKNLSTLEINALVDGALEGGAEQVIVLDGHGSGGINIELIHYEARVMFGRPLVSAWDLGIDFDAMFLYGHHAMENTPGGVLCHSWSSRAISNCWLNGELIGEIGFNIAKRRGGRRSHGVYQRRPGGRGRSKGVRGKYRRRRRQGGAQPYSSPHAFSSKSPGPHPRRSEEDNGPHRGIRALPRCGSLHV